MYTHLVVKDIYTPKSKRKIFFENMLGGLGWGIGSVIGASLVVIVVGFIVVHVRAVPLIGEFVYNIIAEVEKLQGK